MSTKQRIPNLPPEAWTPAVQAIFPILVPPGSTAKGSDFNALLVSAHHPEIADPFVRFNLAVARGVVVSQRLREIAILRLAWRRNCLYEWVHHVIGGASAGLDNSHFNALRLEDPTAPFAPDELAVVHATDEICRDGALSDAMWQEVSRYFDQKQILELLYTIGCFLTVATILNTVRVEVEPAILELVKSNGWPLLDSQPA